MKPDGHDNEDAPDVGRLDSVPFLFFLPPFFEPLLNLVNQAD
jgi:hypothetical protein